MTETKKSPSDQQAGVKAVGRAIAILRVLQREPAGLSIGAIAKRLGLSRSTAQRFVKALELEGFVIPATETERFRLGPALLQLSAAVDVSASRLAKPLMINVAKTIGETVDLSMLTRNHVVFIERAAGSHGGYAIVGMPGQYTPHCCANGKAMLAMLSNAEIERRIGHTFEQRTHSTITSLDKLLADLEKVRSSGVAYSVEENAIGVCAVGVALRDLEGNLISLSVPIPTSRYEEKKAEVALALVDARDRLETMMRR